jgi:hypothetical protein
MPPSVADDDPAEEAGDESDDGGRDDGFDMRMLRVRYLFAASKIYGL